MKTDLIHQPARKSGSISRTRRVLRILLAVSVVVLSALAVGCSTRSSAEGAPPALPTVEVAPVAQENVQIPSEWVATLDGSVNAQIQPQVTGYLIKQNYREGAFVRKGQVLFEIDPRPMHAALDQARALKAQAESQVAQAQSAVMQVDSELAQAEAQLRKAELDVKRDQPMVAARAVSQGQLETEQQALAAADANVRATKARAASSRAAVKASEAAVGSGGSKPRPGRVESGLYEGPFLD